MKTTCACLLTCAMVALSGAAQSSCGLKHSQKCFECPNSAKPIPKGSEVSCDDSVCDRRLSVGSPSAPRRLSGSDCDASNCCEASQQGQYAIGAEGTNKCADGHGPLTSKAACQAAADTLTRAFMSTLNKCCKDNAANPTGCYIREGMGEGVYWNDNPSGMGDIKTRLVCQAVVTTTNTTTSTNATTTSTSTTSTTSTTTTTTKKAAAPTTNVTNVTNVPMTNVTNVTTAGGSTTTFTGKLTVSCDGVNKTQMETATKATLAAQFGVAASAVTVTATESRRLSDFRNLAGSWSIDYSFTVPTSQAAVVEAKVAAIKTSPDDMKAVFKAQLLAAGVSQTEVEAMAITGFTATKTVSEASSTKNKPASSSPSMRHFLSIGITTIAIMSLMFGRLMIGDA